jgi:dihydrodipicolinate synthase/N-acetylneuraminate lyase
MSEHVLECKQGQMSRAQRLAIPFAQLTAALFRESNPAPLKYALSLLGLMSPKVRLPLVELTNPTKAELAGILKDQAKNTSQKRTFSRARAQQQFVQGTHISKRTLGTSLLRT